MTFTDNHKAIACGVTLVLLVAAAFSVGRTYVVILPASEAPSFVLAAAERQRHAQSAATPEFSDTSAAAAASAAASAAAAAASPASLRAGVEAAAAAAQADPGLVVWPTACLADSLLVPSGAAALEACCMANWQAEAQAGDSPARVVTARANGRTFRMGVYKGNDVVSEFIADKGMWEQRIVNDMLTSLADLHAPGASGTADDIDLLDIGGNIGWFSFTVAQHGYRAVAFEPFRQNRNLMKLTACLNPHVVPRVAVFRFALGEQTDECDLLSSAEVNHGNGFTRCGARKGKPPTNGLRIVDAISVRRFDAVFGRDPRRVNLLKIDTEGFELFALRGASQFFASPTRRPWVLYSEFFPNLLEAHNADPVAYLSFLRHSGLHCDAVRGVPEANYKAYVATFHDYADLRCERLPDDA